MSCTVPSGRSSLTVAVDDLLSQIQGLFVCFALFFCFTSGRKLDSYTFSFVSLCQLFFFPLREGVSIILMGFNLSTVS